MSRRRRDQQQHEEANSERWLISYADFITLLFAFFVVMYSISSLNEGKYKTLSKALESSFQHDTRSIKPIQIGEIIKFEKNLKEYDENVFLEDFPTFESLSSTIKTELHALIQDGKLLLKEDKDWIEIVLDSDLLFRTGSVLPKKSSEKIIDDLANTFNKFPNPITVEGFTDSIPIYNDLFPSNWELSVTRAATVTRLLEEKGIEPWRLSATGYSDNFPIADNSKLAGRTKNRRVIFLISRNDPRRAELAKNMFKEPNKQPLIKPTNTVPIITGRKLKSGVFKISAEDIKDVPVEELENTNDIISK